MIGPQRNAVQSEVDGKLADIYIDGDACPVREEIYRVAAEAQCFHCLQRLAPHPAARCLECENGPSRR